MLQTVKTCDTQGIRVMTLKKGKVGVFFWNGTNCEGLFATTAGARDIQKLTLTVKDKYLLQLPNFWGSETAALLGNKSCLWWRKEIGLPPLTERRSKTPCKLEEPEEL